MTPLLRWSVQLEKAKVAYHKACRKEHVAQEREAHAQGNPDITAEKQRKIQDEREIAQQKTQKVRILMNFSLKRELAIAANVANPGSRCSAC